MSKRYIRENAYFGIIIFSCLSSTKMYLRFLLNCFVRQIKGFYQSSLGNEETLPQISWLKIRISKNLDLSKKQTCLNRIKQNNDQTRIMHNMKFWSSCKACKKIVYLILVLETQLLLFKWYLFNTTNIGQVIRWFPKTNISYELEAITKFLCNYLSNYYIKEIFLHTLFSFKDQNNI